MAFEQVVEGLQYAKEAGADLSAKLFYLCKVNTDETIILAGAGDATLGVIREAAASGKPVTVQIGGIAKVIAGGVIAAGALVASDSNGKAATATTGQYAWGMALTASGGANEIISVRMGPYGRVP